MGTMARAAAPADSVPQQHDARDEWPVSGRWPAPGTIHGAWTADDLETLPEDGLRYEIIDGLLFVSPSPIPLHQRIAFRVARLLDDVCPAGHEVLPAPVDWRVDEHTVVEPDVVVVPLPSGKTRFVERPLVAVEVLSRSSRRIDRTVKFDVFEGAGVPQYWVIDPGGASFGNPDRPPSVEVFDLVDGEYSLQVRAVGDDTVTVSGPLDLTVTPTALIA